MLRDAIKKHAPKAPPVCKPAAVQPKMQAPPVYRPHAVAMRALLPKAPPVYQPAAAQPKMKGPQVYRPHTVAMTASRVPAAPPIYKPVAVQPKMQAPPVYRPQALAMRAVQRKVIVRGYENDAQYDAVGEVQALPTWHENYATILTHLSESQKTFVYEDEEAILNEVKTRYELIQAIGALNTLKSEGKVGYSGTGKRESPNQLPVEDWSPVRARHSPNFALADDVSYQPKTSADAALNNLFAGTFSEARAYLECESAMVLSHYRALQQAVGLAHFTKGITASMFDTRDPGEENIHYQLKNDIEEILISSAADLIPGDWVYISNYPGYADHVKGGAYSGENAIYEGNGRYSGFGLPNQSEGQMIQHLRNAYSEGTKGQHPSKGEQDQITSETISGKYPGILKKVHRIKRFLSRR